MARRPAVIFALSGTDTQQQTVREALAACDFPFDRLLDSLRREGKDAIAVDWADLSQRAAADHPQSAHPIVRTVDGRARVLGLFYLPPYTRIVLDVSLTGSLAHEVMLAEAAHAVDYHYMTPEHRRAVVNALHTQQLPPGADVSDGAAFALDGHVCSWFDVGGYAWWCGEAFMEAFVEAFASSVPVTIALAHPVEITDALTIRRALLGEPAPVPTPEPLVPLDGALAVALRRFLGTRQAPAYLRAAATPWLNAR